MNRSIRKVTSAYLHLCAYLAVLFVIHFPCSNAAFMVQLKAGLFRVCSVYWLFMPNYPTDTGVWRLCVWERKTRSTVLMKREPSPLSIRKNEEKGKVKFFPVSGKWCTERLKEKKRSRINARLRCQPRASMYYKTRNSGCLCLVLVHAVHNLLKNSFSAYSLLFYLFFSPK